MLLEPLCADVIGSSSGTVKAGEVRRNFIAEIGGGKEGEGGILYNIIKYYKIL